MTKRSLQPASEQVEQPANEPAQEPSQDSAQEPQQPQDGVQPQEQGGPTVRLVAYTKTGLVHMLDDGGAESQWRFPTLVRAGLPGTLCGCPSPRAGKYATDDSVTLAEAEGRVTCSYCTAIVAKLLAPVQSDANGGEPDANATRPMTSQLTSATATTKNLSATSRSWRNEGTDDA